MDRVSLQVIVLLVFTYIHLWKIQCEVPANEHHLAPKSWAGRCDKICSGQYDPVCGTDGRTYGNKCMLEIKTCKTFGLVQQKSESACPSCFHDESEVMTRGGLKRLRDVSIGEEVLTVSDSGGLRYEPVIVDLHRDAHLHTWFYKIQTQTHEIMVTPKHFLYIGETVESSQLVKVDDVRVGDSLIVNTNATLSTEKVTHIELTYDRGISNPLVASGRILVNNILAAVYADDLPPLEAKHLHSLLWVNRMLSSMKIDIVDVVEEKSGMPYWAAYGGQVLKAFL